MGHGSTSIYSAGIHATKASRLNRRVLWRGWIPLGLEAVVPVRNHPIVGSILYFGANHPSRLPTDDVLRLERNLLDRVMAMPRKPSSEDLHVEILSRHPCDREVAVILEIYLDHYGDRLGDNLRLINPFRPLLDAEVKILFGSDGMPEGPKVGIEYAMNRAKFPEQMITLEEALTAYGITGLD